MSNNRLFNMKTNKIFPKTNKIFLKRKEKKKMSGYPNGYPMEPLPLRIRLMLRYGAGNGPRSF